MVLRSKVAPLLKMTSWKSTRPVLLATQERHWMECLFCHPLARAIRILLWAIKTCRSTPRRSDRPWELSPVEEISLSRRALRRLCNGPRVASDCYVAPTYHHNQCHSKIKLNRLTQESSRATQSRRIAAQLSKSQGSLKGLTN